MNLTLDIGNTAVKWATFEGRTPLDFGGWKAGEATAEQLAGVGRLAAEADGVLACASGTKPRLGFAVPTLEATMPLPIKIDYKTPATLGADRIADACGAAGLHPGQPCLVIDAGTCVTVDFIDGQGTYHGGAIMPGLGMSLRALNSFTARLPLVDIEATRRAPVLGRSTEECILAGTVGATMLALAGFVALYKEKAPGLRVLLTGGDAQHLAGEGHNGWECVPNLALAGLNEVLLANSANCKNSTKERI